MAPDPDPVSPRGSSPATFVDCLRERASRHPDRVAFDFLGDGDVDHDGLSISYSDIHKRACNLAGRLQELAPPGARALLLYPPGLDYLTAFFGCLYAGVVAVPAYPPRPNRPTPRLAAIASDADAAVILTTRTILADSRRWLSETPGLEQLRWLETDCPETAPAAAPSWSPPGPEPSSPAFLQYTSGSTSAPKGVVITHANLVHNSARIQRAFRTGPESRGVFWLPLYHDMGLIGGVLQTLYCGGTSMLLSPVAFLQRPVRWLEAISRTRATISGGPDFAYDLCIRKVTSEQRGTLDLSSWDLAFDGAEPIRPETLRRFVEVFGPCGFRREAFYPCYGLAESTLIVSGGQDPEHPDGRAFRGAELDRGRVVEAETGTDTRLAGDPRVIVGSGRSAPDQTLVIADPDTLASCPADRVGEIWVSSPSVAAGYWNRPEETERAFRARLSDTRQGPFLRTGDLGFLKDGVLYVTGRLKDLIVIRGRNYSPHDLEWTVEQSHPSLRPSSGAAFSVEADGQERLVIAQEVERHERHRNLDAVIAAIRHAVASHHEIDAHAVALLKPGSIPKTSSGKIQRHACREAFLAGTLAEVARWTYHLTATDDPPPTESAAASPPSAEAIQDWLVARLAQRLGIRSGALDIHAPFVSFGMSSAQAVALSGELEVWLGRRLSPTLIYNYPTTFSLSRHLAGCDGPTSRTRTRTPGASATAQALDEIRARALSQVEGSSDDEMDRLIAQEVAKYLK
jgi:acyl-CoA synthetase (AMP-forming)/AMP-acid ligase II